MRQAEMTDESVVDASVAAPVGDDDGATDGWAAPVVQTLPLTSGPSVADEHRPGARRS